MPTVDELRAVIVAKGDEIKGKKADKAPKEVLMPLVNELLALKKEYQEANGGVPYDPPVAPAADKKSKKKDGDGESKVQPERAGPSKKELAKAARKEKKAEAKAGGGGAAAGAGAGAAPGGGVRSGASLLPNPTMAKPTLEGETVFFSPGRAPVVTYATTLLTKATVAFLPYPPTKESAALLEPQLFLMDGTSLFGDLTIARFLARRAPAAEHQALTGGADAFLASEVDQWLDFVQQYHLALAPSEAEAVCANLNSYLELRTYLVGFQLTLADAAVYAFLQVNKFTGHMAALPHLSRWFDLVTTGAPEVATAHNKVMQLSAKAGKSKKAAGEGSGNLGGGDTGSCPPLEGAVEGTVVTRFPPEPSGYLHIGHAKAVLLNDYYAKHYKGKLIIRFDDTNPSKEKDEFEESIINDLASLGVKGDRVTHTSDYFELMEGMARKLIEEGKAYMDNTPQEQMQEERLNRVESKHRNNSVADNLARFETMLGGSKEFCMRAKMDMTSVNGTMRDPVLYRANPEPHHRTGTKFKAYPTYDFACPIVDSIEGVTHALRTTEYNDRDEQYYFLQDTMGLRRVKIQSYSRLNFVQTELSKRKLTWFVENKHVDGWNDPRFPTVQGVIRRGVSVEALRAFILSQGASRRTVLMEWDSFWSLNKKGYEHSAPRYMAVFADTSVPLEITNGPTEANAGLTIPLHPKRPELGTRVLRLAPRVFLEGPDAETVAEGEEITLVRWGNVKVQSITKDPATGKVVGMKGEYNADGDPRSTAKKLTWLADVPDKVAVVLTEFDYLITKKKLEEGEDFKDYLNPVTKAESAGWADPALRNLKQGDVIQLERRGFYICDRPYLGPDQGQGPVLFMIPDGRVKAMSTLSGALKHV